MGGGIPPPTVGRFRNSGMKTAFSCTRIQNHYGGGGGRLCEVAYTNSLLHLFHFLFHSRRLGHGPSALSYASMSDSGAARICEGGGGGEGQARERSNQLVGGRMWFPGSSHHGREILFLKICI